jgi:phosphatidylglycerol:prolipoprotein diacylglycerol transferase
MLTYPNINPIAFHLGPFPVHWYGLMYLIGFAGCWGVLSWRVKRHPRYGFTVDQLSDMLFYVVLGIILGGRIGYMLFYDTADALQHPLHILMIWQGGMSFHGGLIGVLIAMAWYGYKIKKGFLEITDTIAPVIPIGLAAGRIGNFINGELWGKVTDLPWAMVFPNAGSLPRHPSQLYEFLLEGVVLFIVLWIYSSKPRPRGAVSGLFAILYGVFRISVEFVREPDAPIGYLAWGWLTEGQLLSVPLVLVGIILMWCAYRRKKLCSNI